jgi:hypothetical protein
MSNLFSELQKAKEQQREELQSGQPEKTERRNSPPIDRSTGQSTEGSAKLLTSREGNQTVERPKAFYITKRLDRRIDAAVRYLQEKHGIKKADRSVLVNAMMDNAAWWTEAALDLLVDRVISQLTSRLTS